MRSKHTLIALAASLLISITASAESSGNDLILVLDASNSMWGQIDGENKIVIARRAVGQLIDELPDDTEVGLVAYGHRTEGDCEDIETLADVQPIDKDDLKSTINSVSPKGKTPITASLEVAFDLIDPESRASVILISDGLETCSRDPCQAVSAAKASGLPFVLHVVGFDVAGEDTAQLECAAQAGGGLYLAVEDAAQLSDALVTAYEKPETPDGRLAVTVTANGGLQDASVNVFDAETDERVDGGRTYVSDETNPRRIPLEDGRYTATVAAVGIGGRPSFQFDFAITDGGLVERAFDFSSGQVSVLVTRNGELSDATVRVLSRGERQQVAAGRTYVAATSNPRVLTVPAGSYDVEVKSVELKGSVEQRFENVAIAGGETTEIQHDFKSGTLSVEVRRADILIDAVVQIYDADDRSVVGRRAYANESKNPVSFDLMPGLYTVKIREVRGDRTEVITEVTPGDLTEVSVELSQ
ncbi:MAG: VWA domain-containing protein [Woeseiaceae bacterium]|nr:VWA domain-containing protein [Woeseiaceae bacterium]